MGTTLHSSYTEQIENKNTSGNLRYHTRPSLKDVSDAEIKKLISKGCDWYLPGVKWEPNTFVGGRKWSADGKMLERADSTMAQFYWEGPRRIKFRLSLTKPHLANEEEIIEALDLHSRAWTEEIVNFNKNSKNLEVAVVTPSTIR